MRIFETFPKKLLLLFRGPRIASLIRRLCCVRQLAILLVGNQLERDGDQGCRPAC